MINNSNGFFSDEKFNRLLQMGKDGEAVIMPMLSECSKCWRYPVSKIENGENWYCPIRPITIDKTDDAAFQEVLDIDAQLSFSCEGCPLFDYYAAREIDLADADQWHEIKTNYITHGQSASGSGTAFTQNIAIETVENLKKLNKFKAVAIDAEKEQKKRIRGEKTKKFEEEKQSCTKKDPRRSGRTVFNTPGAGWFYKTLKRYEGLPPYQNRHKSIHGDPLLADWYHFYQPIDAWDLTTEVAEATQEEIDKWLNDDSVPRGSTLITQYPFSYCISIKGSYLKEISYFYNEHDMGENHKGKLIPIADLVACHVYRGTGKGIAPDIEAASGTGKLWDSDNMRLFITADSTIIKGTPANGRAKGQRRYIPRRMIEDIEKVYPVRGGLVVGVTPQKEMFKRKENKYDKQYSGAYLIPAKLIWEVILAEHYE